MNITERHQKALHRLVTHMSGEKKSDCAVVIPSGDSVRMLEAHLRRLARQNTHEFDVVIIGKASSRAPRRMNVVTYSEKYPLGSSGGFGIGQVLAYSLGYEYVINADIDCMPVSAGLVKKLKDVAGKTQMTVLPRPVLHSGAKGKIRWGYCPNQYGICPRQVLEEFGFEHFRFFRGAEDLEFQFRLEMAGRLHYENDVEVSHKPFLFDHISLLNSPSNKYIYYKRNDVIARTFMASYAFSRGMAVRGVKYCLATLLDVAKNHIFYWNQPEIINAVQDGLRMDTDTVIARRDNRLKSVKIERGWKGLILDIGSKKLETRRFFPKQKSSFFQTLRIALEVMELFFSDAVYLSPTRNFLVHYRNLLPVLMMAKPVKYSDGMVYTSGMGRLDIVLNTSKTLLLCPVWLVLIVYNAVTVKKEVYPITLSNLERNLNDYSCYVKKQATVSSTTV